MLLSPRWNHHRVKLKVGCCSSFCWLCYTLPSGSWSKPAADSAPNQFIPSRPLRCRSPISFPLFSYDSPHLPKCSFCGEFLRQGGEQVIWGDHQPIGQLSSVWPWVLAYDAYWCRFVFYSPTVFLLIILKPVIVSPWRFCLFYRHTSSPLLHIKHAWNNPPRRYRTPLKAFNVWGRVNVNFMGCREIRKRKIQLDCLTPKRTKRCPKILFPALKKVSNSCWWMMGWHMVDISFSDTFSSGTWAAAKK